jgi:tetratricopeptide (TPR) repeat protein
MNRASQLSAFADQDPENPILLCDLLDELLAGKDLDGVGSRLASTPRTMRELPGVRFREARHALMRGDAGQAVRLLQSLLASMNDAPVGVVHDLAYAQFVHGQTDEALRTLGSAPHDGGDAVVLQLLKAKILHAQQQYQTAIDTLTPFASGGRATDVLGMRALLWLDQGDTHNAKQDSQQALQGDRDQHEACLVAGTLALWAHRLDEAIGAFEHVLEQHPDSGRAWHGIGQATLLRGDAAAARFMLERASLHAPDHIGTWHTLAWCQLVSGDPTAAKLSFDRAFALDRTFGETHGGYAVVHAMRGEHKEAQDSIRRATRLDPGGRSARYARSLLLFADGRADEARRIVDELRVSVPGRGTAVSADFIFSSCVGLPVAGGEHGQ